LGDTPEVILYTDGACSGNPGPGGWAALLKHPASRTLKSLSGGDPQTTNNRMELTAAIEGLRSLKTDRRCRVHLVSDSEYLIFGLTQWIEGWIAKNWRRGKSSASEPVKNVDLWKSLHELALRHDMTYEHVAAHTGHPENEECDRLANEEIKALRRAAKDAKMLDEESF
jgi:ribonuclease HI